MRRDALSPAQTEGTSKKPAVGGVAPGVLLAVGVMLVAQPAADVIARYFLPVSSVLVAILAGLAIRNLIGLPAAFAPGIKFTVTTILRCGIILIGIKLSVVEMFKLGVWGVPVVMTAIASGLLLITWFTRLLKVPERLGLLIAAGTSICGITAILSTAPAIDADDEEVAYAVANVTIFGLVAMSFYPYLAHWLFRTPAQVGLFLGTAVHDTSQVVGAAIHYQELFREDSVLQTATVTKLTRNLFLAVIVPLISYIHWRRNGIGSRSKVNLRTLTPLFILGFIGMAAVRSIGDSSLQSGLAFGIWDASAWNSLTAFIGDRCGSRYLLGTAMAGVGLGTNLAVFKGIGLRPLAVGLIGAVLVGLVGMIMAILMGQFVHL